MSWRVFLRRPILAAFPSSKIPIPKFYWDTSVEQNSNMRSVKPRQAVHANFRSCKADETSFTDGHVLLYYARSSYSSSQTQQDILDSPANPTFNTKLSA